MSEQENMAVAHRSFDAWNAHDVDAWLKVLAENQITESDTVPAPFNGHKAARPFMEMYVKAFPDLHFTVDQMIASDDYVVTRYTATGTHKGELSGIPPTGRRAEVHGCTTVQIRNGKIVRQWIYWDTGHLLRQLGVLPATG